MSELKRYELNLITNGHMSHEEMQPDEDGDWVEFEDHQSEIQQLQAQVEKHNRLMENGLICATCEGVGCVGNPPDDYFDCPDCVKRNKAIKAEGVRESKKVVIQKICDDFGLHLFEDGGSIAEHFEAFARQLTKEAE